MSTFPVRRMRRLRTSESIRSFARETRLAPEELVMPLFIKPGYRIREEIRSMPGNFHLSVDRAVEEAIRLEALGVGGVLLFGLPEIKDHRASHSAARHGIVQRAIRAIKRECRRLLVITDVCLCGYMDHGHCGVAVRERGDTFRIDNDETLKLLAAMAVSHAQAGADIVAPSDMMDGRVAAIRQALDQNGCKNTPIMSYSAKYASSFYGPFREAANSAPVFGDRRTYQMDPANGDEALREIELDIQEGADIVMVKPALPYLDVIWRAKNRFGLPLAAYCVSGEFAMAEAAARMGWLDRNAIIMEMLTCIRRAGADIIITYWAKEAAERLQEEPASRLQKYRGLPQEMAEGDFQPQDEDDHAEPPAGEEQN